MNILQNMEWNTIAFCVDFGMNPITIVLNVVVKNQGEFIMITILSLILTPITLIAQFAVRIMFAVAMYMILFCGETTGIELIREILENLAV
jgi:hypothetical protein